MKPPLKVLLFSLVVLTPLSGLQKIFGLSAPPPEWQPTIQLRLSGYQFSLLSDQAGSTGRDFSRGSMRRFRFQSLGNGPTIELTSMAVSSIKPDLLQLERITHNQPSLSLKKPRFLSHPQAQNSALPNDQLAIATAHGQTRLQTCLMRSGKAGYWQTTLGDEWIRDELRRFDGQPGQKYLDYLKRFLALQPSQASEYLVVQLETNQTPTDQETLLKAWNAMKPQLLAHKNPYCGSLPTKP